jgi:pimeloyl-ACP methyl ester carboxylesterase
VTCLRCSAAPKITDSAALERSLTAIEAFDQFAMQGLPRWVTNDAATQKAYDALVEKVCPCVVVVHSQGGSFGFNAAVTAPDKIKALVAIEPSGAPDSANVDVGKLKGVPHLIVWGSATRSRSGSACPSLRPDIATPSSRPVARPITSTFRPWALRTTPTC